MTAAAKTEQVRKGRRLSGTIVSDKMTDTAVVVVTRFTKHPKYKKYMKSEKRYMAHNPGNTHKVGEKVVIEECRPLSKNKSFKIIEQ